MRGKWFIELAELDSFNKAESEAAKQFFGQYIDRFRNFYGKRASDVPRQQVFTGTTNKINGYLKDETGNRRYWPVAVFEIMLDLLREIRDQLWAEAVEAFKAGEAFWETPADVDIFREAQDARFIEDSYTELIANGLLGKSVTSVTDVLQDILKLDVAKWTMPEQQRVGRSMTRLGWIRKRDSGGKRDWKYHRPAPATPAPTSGEPPRPAQDDDAPF
jgi:predicted P-loop ATPase